MHKKRFAGLSTALLLMILTSACVNSEQSKHERQIVGSWLFSQLQDDENMSVVMELNTDFQEDKSEVFDGYMRIRAHVDDGDYANTITFEYAVTGGGTWEVDGDYFVEKINKCDIRLQKVSTMIQLEDDDVYIGSMKEMLEDGMPGIRSSIMKKSKDKIVKLTDDEFIIEDEDGNRETYTKTVSK